MFDNTNVIIKIETFFFFFLVKVYKEDIKIKYIVLKESLLGLSSFILLIIAFLLVHTHTHT